ncbi:hypothetical protein WJX64_03940 [Leifsonia sp. YIM 134122]|uniref:Uncharacterized protein n=1 Tax=Leifsonia stereocauli TaxID=3134136 RepID=A0ABU9W116_9MICO
MLIIIVLCSAAVAVGLAMAVIWGGREIRLPPQPIPNAGQPWARRHLAGLRLYAWWATLLTVTGIGSGIVASGAGGRLIMRALAATSPEAIGRLTEASEVVGDVTPIGTLAYLLFAGIPFGLGSTVIYFIVHPWLPRGRRRGPAFGLLLLVTIAPFSDPLRADNVDFDIVGPGWLAVALFSVLAVLHGTVVVAIAGRCSEALPLLSRRNWGAGLPLAAAVVYVPLGAALAIVAVGAFLLPRALPWTIGILSSRAGIVTGRIFLGVLTVLAIPAFVMAIVSITTR